MFKKYIFKTIIFEESLSPKQIYLLVKVPEFLKWFETTGLGLFGYRNFCYFMHFFQSYMETI